MPTSTVNPDGVNLPIADPGDLEGGDSDATQEYEDEFYSSKPEPLYDVDYLVSELCRQHGTWASCYKPCLQAHHSRWSARTQREVCAERREYLRHEGYLVREHELQLREDRGNENLVEIEFDSVSAKLVTAEKIQPDEVYVVRTSPGRGTGPPKELESVIEKAFDTLNAQEVKDNWKLVEAAIRKEVRSWHDLKTFEIGSRSVLKNILDTRWVLKWKLVDGERVVKARLCVRGFKDKQFQSSSSDQKPEFQTYAGTATRWGQRFVVSVAVAKGWKLQSADVGSAFLQGVTFEELSSLTGEPLREVAFEPPRGFAWAFQELPGLEKVDFNKYAMRMLKPGFGLKDAPRAWRVKLHRVLLELGGRPLKVDAQLYIWVDNNKLVAILSTHVDDLKAAGVLSVVAKIFHELEVRFGSMKVQVGKFEHCGVVHEQLEDGTVLLHQNQYIDQLRPLSLSPFDDVSDDTFLKGALYSVFRTALGVLSWLVQTRYDVSVYVAALQRVAQTPRMAHLRKVGRVLKWVRRRRYSIRYRSLRRPLKVLVVSDSSFRKEDNTGLAMRGAFVCIAEQQSQSPGGRVHVIEVFSKKQRRVMRSTFGAEILGLNDAVEFGKLIAIALAELCEPTASLKTLADFEQDGTWPIGIEAVTDARAVKDAILNTDQKTPREDSLVLTLLQMRDNVATHRLRKLWWCDTLDMIADGLTKGAVSRSSIIRVCETGEWILSRAFA